MKLEKKYGVTDDTGAVLVRKLKQAAAPSLVQVSKPAQVGNGEKSTCMGQSIWGDILTFIFREHWVSSIFYLLMQRSFK